MDPFPRLANSIVLLLAVVVASFRPITNDANRDARWQPELRRLLEWYNAWHLASFLAGWYLDRRGIESARANRLLVSRKRDDWASPAQIALFEDACRRAYSAKAEWEVAAAGAAMAAALVSVGFKDLEAIVALTEDQTLAEITFWPTAQDGTEAKFEAIANDNVGQVTGESRLERFERGDFEARTASRSLVPTQADPDSVVAAKTLSRLGHSDVEIASLLAGPSRADGRTDSEDETAVALRHLVRLGYSESAAQALLAGPRRA